jgi:hypothetical protein
VLPSSAGRLFCLATRPGYVLCSLPNSFRLGVDAVAPSSRSLAIRSNPGSKGLPISKLKFSCCCAFSAFFMALVVFPHAAFFSLNAAPLIGPAFTRALLSCALMLFFLLRASNSPITSGSCVADPLVAPCCRWLTEPSKDPSGPLSISNGGKSN